MPASMHIDTLQCVNDALLESFASANNNSGSNSDHVYNHHYRRNNNRAHASSNNTTISDGTAYDSSDEIDSQSVQSKLYANSKNILDAKIEFEEVGSYNKSVLDEFKNKYLNLRSKPSSKANNSNGNNATNQASNQDDQPNGDDTNGNQNTNRLPEPKYALYPREQIRPGWSNTVDHKWVTGTGITNLGNTCYLNSTLQALFHVPCVAKWLLSDREHREKCLKSKEKCCIICAVATTLMLTQKERNAVQPYGVYNRLKFICKHLLFGKQEDAHEFLRYLIDCMEETYLKRFPNIKDMDQYTKQTTPINYIFGSYIKSAVRCLACGYVSVTYQYFQDLILDIRKVNSLEDALDAYFATEVLEDMSYNCSSCKKKVSATKQFSMEKLPVVLCIQLKRFSVVGSKITKLIPLKLNINMSKYLSSNIRNENASYRLTSAIMHYGNTQHYGHYAAIGVDPSGTYYSFDDSFVQQVHLRDVCNTNPYIIFYELDKPAVNKTNELKVIKPPNDTIEDRDLTPRIANITSSTGILIGPKLPSDKSSINDSNNSAVINNTNNGMNVRTFSSLHTPFADNRNINEQTKYINTNNDKKNNLLINYKSNHTTTMTTTNSSIRNADANNTSVSTTSTTSSFLFLEAFANLKNGVNKQDTNGTKYAMGCNWKEDQQTKAKLCSSKLINGENKKNEFLMPYSSNGIGDDAACIDTSMKCRNSNFNCNSIEVMVPSSSDKGKNDFKLKNNGSSNTNNDFCSWDTKRKPLKTVDTSFNNGQENPIKPRRFLQKMQRDNCDSNTGKKQGHFMSKDTLSLTSSIKTSQSMLLHDAAKESLLNNHFNVVSMKSAGKIDNLKKVNCGDEARNGNKRMEYDRKHKIHISTTGHYDLTAVKCSKPDDAVKVKNNPYNPFMLKPPSRFSFKPSKAPSFKADTGYCIGSTNSSTDDSIRKLAHESHRGYGARILKWSGKESNTAKEITNEVEKRTLRDQDHDNENEIDSGAPKRIKLHHDNNSSGGRGNFGYRYNSNYNPFQEKQNQGSYARNYNPRYYNANQSRLHYQQSFQRSSTNNGGFNQRHIYDQKYNFQRNNFRFRQQSQFKRNLSTKYKDNGYADNTVATASSGHFKKDRNGSTD